MHTQQKNKLLLALPTILIITLSNIGPYHAANKKSTTEKFAFVDIDFKYANTMHCTKDNPNALCSRWLMEGQNSLVEVYRIKYCLPYVFINRIKEDSKAEGYKVEEVPTTLHHDNQVVKGTLLKIDTLQDIKQIQEIYAFKTTDHTVTFVVLIDTRDNFEIPSQEFIAMKKNFINTLRLKKESKPIL